LLWQLALWRDHKSESFNKFDKSCTVDGSIFARKSASHEYHRRRNIDRSTLQGDLISTAKVEAGFSNVGRTGDEGVSPRLFDIG